MAIPNIKDIIEKPIISPVALPRTIPNIKQIVGVKTLARAKVPEPSFLDVIRGIPTAAKKVAKAIPELFVPAITEFFKVTGGIFGEGLAYLVDPNVRKQYEAGNLEILPTITKTSISDVAKKTGGAMIEAAVYKIIPSTIRRNVFKRFGIGALQGIGFAISEGLAKDQTPKEIIDNMKTYGPIAAAVEVVAPYLAKALTARVKDLPKLTKQSTKEVIEEIRRPFAKALEVKAIPVVKPPVRVAPEPRIAIKEVVPVERGIIPPTEKVIGKPAKVAKSIEAKSIERGLTESFGEVAEYTPVTIKEQAKLMSDLMTSDIAKARRIAIGIEPLPKEIKGATALKAMEDYAMEKGNGKLALELANSPLARETSEAGQTLRLIAEREPDSATARIQEIVRERTKATEVKLRGQSAKKVKSGMKVDLDSKIAKAKAKPTKYAWTTLIDEITC